MGDVRVPFTTRVVHDHLRGVEVAPTASGSMCVSGLAAGDGLQTIEIDLRDTVRRDAMSAWLLGQCASEATLTDGTAGLASPAVPCDDEHPWVTGQAWSTAPMTSRPTACRPLADVVGSEEWLALPLPGTFSRRELVRTEFQRDVRLDSEESPSDLVPRVEVVVGTGDGETL